MKKTVLALSSHPGGTKAIIPVIKKLMKEDQVKLVIIGHNYAIPILKENHVNYKTIEDYNLNNVSIDGLNKISQIEKLCSHFDKHCQILEILIYKSL